MEQKSQLFVMGGCVRFGSVLFIDIVSYINTKRNNHNSQLIAHYCLPLQKCEVDCLDVQQGTCLLSLKQTILLKGFEGYLRIVATTEGGLIGGVLVATSFFEFSLINVYVICVC